MDALAYDGRMRTVEQIAAVTPTTSLVAMDSLIDLDAALASITNRGGGYVRNVRVPLAALVTNHDVMVAVTTEGTPSDTPDEPVDLCVRNDVTGRYEVADGHHRVASALLSGADHIVADIYPIADDEPYEGPFYDFAALSVA